MRTFHTNYKNDDYLLGLSPLMLLFFINKNNKFDILLRNIYTNLYKSIHL
jgi:hypothetical protein